MSLITAHRILIIAAIVMFTVYGVVELRGYARSGEGFAASGPQLTPSWVALYSPHRGGRRCEPARGYRAGAGYCVAQWQALSPRRSRLLNRTIRRPGNKSASAGSDRIARLPKVGNNTAALPM
jgi:hypothetical protein